MSLHLFPNFLGPVTDHTLFLPHSIDLAVATIQGMIAESEKGARQFLKHFKKHVPIALLSEDADFLLEPVLKGESWGLVSDAGLPCLADPGHLVVKRAHSLKIPVFAYPGPSALTHALILSGLPGQQFTFHGYIPKDPAGRTRALQTWERNEGTQIFIEAPYRNLHTFKSCLESLEDRTLLCLGWDLTLPTQGLITQPVGMWKRQEVPPIHKVPTIFLFKG